MSSGRPALLYFLLLAPIAYLVFLVGLPVLYDLVMSVQEVNIGNLASLSRPFVGLDHFREVIADESFRRVLGNTAVFVVVNVIFQVGLGLVLALLFAERFPGSNSMRGLLLIGWMLPGLVVGALWKWMLASDYGVLNFFLMRLGLITVPIRWLSDPSLALTSVSIAQIWYGTPFSMILIAAALAGLQQDQYEAAALDGAGPIARFRYLTLPELTPTLAAVACIVVIYAMRAFDVIFALTQGGPLDGSNVLPLLSYQFSFQQFQFGMGAAVGSFSFLIVFVVALVYVAVLKREAKT